MIVKKVIELNINGDSHELLVFANHTLLEVLRDKLGLMGTKRGCDLGACGACTVLINGEAYLSCIMLAADAVGKEIITIEGLASGGDLHPLQNAFVDQGALQCGFCTPGVIMSANAVIDIGVSCRVVSRLVAVTSTSSKTRGSESCAAPETANTAAIVAATRAINEVGFSGWFVTVPVPPVAFSLWARVIVITPPSVRP